MNIENCHCPSQHNIVSILQSIETLSAVVLGFNNLYITKINGHILLPKKESMTL